MRKFCTLLAVAAIAGTCPSIGGTLSAQAPQLISYQAVARDGTGALKANASVNVSFVIRSSSASGPIVYEENHVGEVTNQFGLFSLMIGGGAPVTGDMTDINWGGLSHWLEVKVDGVSMGSHQLASVPYSLGPWQPVDIGGVQALQYGTGDTAAVLIGRDFRIGNEWFGVRANTDADDYGGMYIETSHANGWPFYGYATDGSFKAWTYYNGTTGGWHLYNAGLKLTVTNTGYTGFRTSTPATDLHVKQSATVGSGTTGGLKFESSSSTNEWKIGYGSVNDFDMRYNDALNGYFADGSGAYTAVSDASLKTEVEPLSGMLLAVKQLQPVKYYFKQNRETADAKSYGFIAQEVEAVLPELVHEKEGIKMLAYTDFGVIAIKAIQEQQTQIEAQQAQIEFLKGEIEALKESLNK